MILNDYVEDFVRESRIYNTIYARITMSLALLSEGPDHACGGY